MIPYSHQTIDNTDIKAVIEVLKSDWLTQGPKVAEFEYKLCQYTGAKYAIAVCNATSALHLACLAANIQKDDEVITSPITFASTTNAVIFCGGKPVFADIQEDTVNIDPQEIIKKITKSTKAIIPIHFAGHPADLLEIQKIAKKRKLSIIEDASHALGAVYQGSKIGSCKYADMTVFSFHPVKSITTGEGGAITTNSKDLYDKLVLLRTHGITKDPLKFKTYNPQTDGAWYYEMQALGFNYRITDIQCALGISQIRRLDNFINKRKRIVDFYNRAFRKNRNISIPTQKSYVKSSWHIYYIRLKDQSQRLYLFNKLKELNIGAQVHYIPVYYHPFYDNKFGYHKGFCPKAEDYYSKTVTIPLYPTLTQVQVNYIVKAVTDILP